MRKDPRMLAALEQLAHAQREVELLKAQLVRKQNKLASTGNKTFCIATAQPGLAV